MPSKKPKAPQEPPIEVVQKAAGKLSNEEPHEGHHYITIVFLVAVLFTIIFLIPPSIIPLPGFSKQAQPVGEVLPAQIKAAIPVEVAVPAEEKTPEPEEPAIDYELLFVRKALNVNKQNNYGLFETKLLRVGFFTDYNNASQQEETHFRADMWVKNAGKAKEDFNAFNGYIKSPPNVYKVIGGTFKGEDVSPGETRQGYLLYDAPKNLSGEFLLSIGTALGYSAVFGFQTQNHYSYEIKYPPGSS